MVAALAALGLAGVIAGLFAIRYCAAARRDARWRAVRAASYAAGALLAVGSYALRGRLSYAGEGPEGPGTVVGIPFFVAFTDASGAGGVTFLTVPLALLNALFWFLLPQLLLAAFALTRRRKR